MTPFWSKDDDEEEEEEEEEVIESSAEVKEYGTYEEEFVPGENIVLKDGNEEGLYALVQTVEEITVEQQHDGTLNTVDFQGNLIIKNPSEIDRIWNIDLTLANIEKTSIEDNNIEVRELGTTDEDNTFTQEFELPETPQNLLIVKEYINSLENADDILNITDIENDLIELKDSLAGQEAEGSTQVDEEEDLGEDEEDLDEDIDEDEDYDGGIEEDSDEDLTDEYDEEYDGGVEAVEYDLESFAVSKEKETTITFAIAARNFFDKPTHDISIVKNMPDEFSNIMIVDTTIGSATQEGSQIIWAIENLEPETTALLKFKADIFVEDIETKKTGTVEITFKGDSSYAGELDLEEFSAYTRNRFFVDLIERDEEPGVWDCNLVFENNSEFFLEISNIDIHEQEGAESSFVELDAEDLPKLPAGAEFRSNPWQYESEAYPSFSKKVEFRVLPQFMTSVSGNLTLLETGLDVASIKGKVIYSRRPDIEAKVPKEEAEEEVEVEEGEEVELEGEEAEVMEAEEEFEGEEVAEEAQVISVPTFKETDIYAIIEVENEGSAPLNKVLVTQQFFNDEFQAPNQEEISVFVEGEEIEYGEEAVSMEKNMLKVDFTNLKDTNIGMLESGQVMVIRYPIHCVNPSRDAQFESDVILNANTFPLSQELEAVPVAPIIKSVHLRRKFRLGKEVIPVGALGEYEIRLFVENVGNMPLEDFVIRDKVPDNFEYTDLSMEAEITDEAEEDILTWTVEKLEEEQGLEITYKISGQGEYRARDAQVAL